MRTVMGLLLVGVMTTGCVSKAKYAELESQYGEATSARDQAMADADAAKNELQEFKERNRKRLEKFTAVYEELLKVQTEKLATVKIEDSESGEASVYTIVGNDESDAKQGLISINSPLAQVIKASIAPVVSSGQTEKARLAEQTISLTATASAPGKPCPPKAGEHAMPFQPPAQYWR